MISADEATEVARAAGLGLGDAAALVQLADDRAHAERLAARFAATQDDGPTLGDAIRDRYTGKDDQ